MSKEVFCPFCKNRISVSENAAQAVCMICGNGFSLGVSPFSNIPQVQFQQPIQPAPQMQFQQPIQSAPQIQFQQPGQPAPQVQFQQPIQQQNYQNQDNSNCRKPRAVGGGLYYTAIVFNILVLVATSASVSAFISAEVAYDGWHYIGEGAIAAAVVAALFFTVAEILNLICVAKFWKILLPHQAKKTTPAMAALFMLIPVFNWFWTFKMHIRLGAGLAERSNDPEVSSKGCGIAGAIFIFLGSCYPLVQPLQTIGWLIALAGYQNAAVRIEYNER